jgi:hypothetical protein
VAAEAGEVAAVRHKGYNILIHMMDMDTTTVVKKLAPPRSRGPGWLLFFIVLLAVVFGALYYFIFNSTKPNTNSYQAVFLNNNQVYFGKLSISGDWVTLEDVYYLKATDTLQQTTTADSKKPVAPAPNPGQKIELVKLGNELHGPEDKMFIVRDKVVFWENMKAGSKVLEAIKAYKGGSQTP